MEELVVLIYFKPQAIRKITDIPCVYRTKNGTRTVLKIPFCAVPAKSAENKEGLLAIKQNVVLFSYFQPNTFINETCLFCQQEIVHLFMTNKHRKKMLQLEFANINLTDTYA